MRPGARSQSWIWIVSAWTVSTTAWARGGGGELFNSGRSDSFDFGSGGIPLDLLFLLLARHPLLGIVLIIAFIALFAYARSGSGETATRRALDRADALRQTTIDPSQVAQWISELKASDPSFDLDALLSRVRSLFGEVQGAWFQRDLEGVRRYLSDATFRRLALQLRIMDAQGMRDAIDEPIVHAIRLVGFARSSAFETVQFSVRASLRDTDVAASASDAEARAAASRSAPEEFIEVWSLVRRCGVRTDATRGPIAQGQCPNCGAPFNGGAANTCTYCKAIVNSGNYDWVLAAITQGSEFVEARSYQALEAIRVRDPGFAAEVLEDRAALIFWLWIDAQLREAPDAIAKVALPAMRAALTSQIERRTQARRSAIIQECAVGVVRCLAIESADGTDRASVEIRWSARIGEAASGTRKQVLPNVPFRSVMLLVRNANATTSTATGLSTSRCPNCSAPLGDNGDVKCDFCGSDLASGSGDWVLERILRWEEFLPSSAKSQVQRAPSLDERKRLLFAMAVVAYADGTLDRRERSLLENLASRWSVAWSNVELALHGGFQLFESTLLPGSIQAEQFLRQLVAIALVDDRIDVREGKLLEFATNKLGLSSALLKTMISEARDSPPPVKGR